MRQKEPSNFATMLVGTRNGDMFEASLQFVSESKPGEIAARKKSTPAEGDEEGSLSSEESEKDQTEEQYPSKKGLEYEKIANVKKEKEIQGKILEVNYNYWKQPLRNHSGPVSPNINSKKKLIFAMHPVYPIMITVGEDQRLCVWDTERFKLMKSQDWGLAVTAIRFIPDNGDMLALGLVNGRITIIESKFLLNQFGSMDERKSLLTSYVVDL